MSRRTQIAHGVLALGVAVTMIAAVSPQDALLFRGSTGRAVLETLVAVVALAALWVAERRFRESDSAADLCLVVGLAVFVIAHITLNAAPAVFQLSVDTTYSLGAAPGRSLAAAFIAAAAFASQRPLERGTRRLATASAALAVVATAAGGVAFLASGLPGDPDARVAANILAALREATAIGIVHVAAAVLFAAAAVGFSRRARASGDELWAWFALAFGLLALSRVNYVVVPGMLEGGWISSADALRAASAAALAGAVTVDLRELWRRVAAAAVARERRRLARVLHDGVVQDLAFIISQSSSSGEQPGAAWRREQIAAAAERALESSRKAISELTRSQSGSFAEAIRSRAGQLASRWGMTLHVDVDDHVSLRDHEFEEIMGLVSEAISNAARHARAEHVSVELRPGAHDRVRLRISDDGAGFDPAAPLATTGGGFGLVSMRERAAALGGEIRLESEPGTGTLIEVALQ